MITVQSDTQDCCACKVAVKLAHQTVVTEKLSVQHGVCHDAVFHACHSRFALTTKIVVSACHIAILIHVQMNQF